MQIEQITAQTGVKLQKTAKTLSSSASGGKFAEILSGEEDKQEDKSDQTTPADGTVALIMMNPGLLMPSQTTSDLTAGPGISTAADGTEKDTSADLSGQADQKTAATVTSAPPSVLTLGQTGITSVAAGVTLMPGAAQTQNPQAPASTETSPKRGTGTESTALPTEVPQQAGTFIQSKSPNTSAVTELPSESEPISQSVDGTEPKAFQSILTDTSAKVSQAVTSTAAQNASPADTLAGQAVKDVKVSPLQSEMPQVKSDSAANMAQSNRISDGTRELPQTDSGTQENTAKTDRMSQTAGASILRETPEQAVGTMKDSTQTSDISIAALGTKSAPDSAASSAAKTTTGGKEDSTSQGQNGTTGGQNQDQSSGILAQTTVSSATPFELNVGDKVKTEAASVANQLSRAVDDAVQSDRSEIRFHLSPEDLGGISIKIVSQSGSLSLQITAENHHTGSLIASNMGELNKAIADRGINMNKAEVMLSSDGGYQSMSGSQERNLQQENGKMPVWVPAAKQQEQDSAVEDNTTAGITILA
ncbi:MAG TPA: flagellar hook-length control protein FliK [Clostridia bacterium]|nr:flagellar hook-length control protein FliK [Clostridia bacterium]